jgi:hypothetical protein
VGIFLARLSTRFFKVTLLLAVLWVAVVGVRNLADVDRMWKAHQHEYAPSAVSALHSFLLQRGIRGAYADYWDAYSLALLTNEEIVFAPYNGLDRYHPYMVTVQSLPVQAFVFRPGLLPPEASSTQDLVDFLNVLRPFTGRGHRDIVRQLNRQVVVERVNLDQWDIWLVSNETGERGRRA